MEANYNPRQKEKGRFWWLVFSVINTFSFQFLAGNVIILFIIRLGASKSLVGFVSAFFHIGYFIMPIGRMLSQKIGIVRGFGWAWMLRYLAISPILMAPLIAISGGVDAYPRALWLVVIAYSGFQLIRGAGLVSYSPVVTEISHGSDRGRFLSQSRIVTDISILLGVLAVAFYLGDDAPFIRYMISFSVGILLGFAGVFALFKIPEINRPRGHRDEPLIQSIKTIWKTRKYRNFFAALLVIMFVSGTFRPFILVYVKDLYELSDNRVLFLTIAGSLGALTMGIISRQFLDRLGAKPMLLIWIVLMMISCLAIIAVPVIASIFMWVFLTGLFYVSTMGLNGADNTTKTYFFSMILPHQQLNFGILFFLATGISGSIGSTLAGVLLDFLQLNLELTVRLSHIILYSILLVLLFLALMLAANMERLGALTLRQSLSEIFSIRQRNRGQG